VERKPLKISSTLILIPVDKRKEKMNEKDSLRSQGAMEYLIVIGTVITIAAVAMVIVSGAMGQRQEEILYDQCSSAASRCNTRRAANPETTCAWCEKQCVDNDGNPLFGEENKTNAIDCCMLGLDDEIFLGAGAEGDYKNKCEPSLEADFSYSISGLEVYFTDSSRFDPYHPDYNITDWSWEFGDGDTSTEQNPVHNYSSQSVYNATLKVDGKNQETGKTYSDEITKKVVWEGLFINNLEVKQSEIYEGENITIQGQIENAGDESETQEVTIESDLWTDSKTVSIDGGRTKGIDFEYQTSRTERGNYTATVETEDDSETLDFRIKGNYSVEFISGDIGYVAEPGEETFYYLEGDEVEIGAQPGEQEEFEKIDENSEFIQEDEYIADYYSETANVSEASEMYLEATYEIDYGDPPMEGGFKVEITGGNVDEEIWLTAEETGTYTQNETISVYGVDQVEVNFSMYAFADDGTFIEVTWERAMHYPDSIGASKFDEWLEDDTDFIIDPNARETNITDIMDDVVVKATFTGN